MFSSQNLQVSESLAENLTACQTTWNKLNLASYVPTLNHIISPFHRARSRISSETECVPEMSVASGVSAPTSPFSARSSFQVSLSDYYQRVPSINTPSLSLIMDNTFKNCSFSWLLPFCPNFNMIYSYHLWWETYSSGYNSVLCLGLSFCHNHRWMQLSFGPVCGSVF